MEKSDQALFFVSWHQHTLSREGCDNRLFVKRIVLVLSATVLVLLLEGSAMTLTIFDHERLDVYRLGIDYVAFSYPIDGASQF